ncbi:MAG: biotin--[acetyl-CoA-carboxylase] ligase [Candidatus Hydrogenedentota bacterium]
MTSSGLGDLSGLTETALVGSRIFYVEETSSTNDLALARGMDGDVFVADRQTAGRGRLGRSWHSAPGKGLWFSIALANQTPGVVFAAALSVRDACAPKCALRVKWPNDLLLEGKKVCGILAEHRNGLTALGIGINVHHDAADFPDELREKAGSLAMAPGAIWDRAALLRGVLTELDRRVILLRSGGFERVRDDWADACNIVGRRISIDGAEGTVSALDDLGRIVLSSSNGPRTFAAGDVVYLPGA